MRVLVGLKTVRFCKGFPARRALVGCHFAIDERIPGLLLVKYIKYSEPIGLAMDLAKPSFRTTLWPDYEPQLFV